MKLDHFINAVSHITAHRDRHKTAVLDRPVVLPDGTPVGGFQIERDVVRIIPGAKRDE